MSIGVKYDGEKPAISLIPAEAIEEIAIALTYGAKKYGRYNFRTGIEHTRLVDAALRHILAYLKNEDIDQESGNHHISHAAASLAMLIYLIKNKPELDDRFKNDKNDPNS